MFGVKNNIFIVLLIISFSTSSCTNFRQAIGSEKNVLDEFSIVEKNKLEMPPNFDLKSEMKKTHKTGSKAKDQISLLFEVERRNQMDNLDKILAQFFQFNSIDPNIREIIDQETYNLQINSRVGIDIIFGSNNTPKIGPFLDTLKEKERLENLQ